MPLIVVPQVTKTDLSPLIGASSEVLGQFVKIAVEFLRQGETRKKYVVAAQALELPVAVVEHAVEALSWLLVEAARMLIRERDFVDSLLIVGFEQAFADAVWSLYAANSKELRRILTEDQLAVPTYKDLRWRLDVQLASRTVHSAPKVVYILRIDFEDGRTVMLETDLPNLRHITDRLEQALNAASTAEWKTRTVYQFLTDRFANPNPSASCSDLSKYCGGTFSAASGELEYVKALGFDAVWISPIVTNTANGYHGYWALDFNSVNAHFGSAQQLQDMVSAYQQQDVWVMLDLVCNHVGPVGDAFGQITPFNQSGYYHACGGCPSQCNIQDYTCFTYQIETCRLSGLPDLNQTVPFVAQFFTDWVQNVLATYHFDGLRLDTVPEIEPGFWQAFQRAAGVYAVGEVFVSDMACLQKYASVIDGVLSYPMFFTLRNVFTAGQSLVQINQTRSQYHQYLPDPAALLTFVDNHDNARFLYQNPDVVSYKAALAYVLLAEGIPCVYYGTEQGFNGGNDPQNREPLWPSKYNTQSDLFLYIQTVVAYRKSAQVWLYPHVERTVNAQLYAWTRGDTFIAVTNNHQTVRYNQCNHPYANNQRLQNLFYPSDIVTVTAGCFPVDLNNGEVKVFFPIQ